jgi:hypothetical protein
MPGRIDPDTGDLIDIDRSRSYTLAEIRQITPACPRCESTVSVAPIKRSSLAGSGPMDAYMIGRHTFNCHCFSG